MKISIWRLSHFILAITSAVFLLLATLTGLILACEPIFQKSHAYHVEGSNQLSIAKTLKNVSKTYPEIISITKDEHDFIILDAVVEGENKSFYINPFTGEKLGEIIQKNKLFKFARNFHRSLFLKKTGRFIVGVTSFFFLLIAISGVVIIAKRQGGIFKFFSKIVKENFEQYYHIVLSRWTLIPIVLIAISGIYLSLYRFKIIKEEALQHQVDFDKIKETPKLKNTAFEVFSNYTLSDLKKLDFPFSEFPEDYYDLKLEDKHMLVNQFTGEILSELNITNTTILKEFMFVVHTGSSNFVWAVVLLVAMLVTLFLMYSGFAMRIKKTKASIQNQFTADEATHIILVGTEGKTTLKFASVLHQQLLNLGIRSFLAEMNAYSTYKNIEHLMVLTSTFGAGEAPSNAHNFLGLFSYVKQIKPYCFSVVGFGSTSYPEFCKFAYAVDNTLGKHNLATQLIPIHTVNNQSFEAFAQWTNLWAGKNNLDIKLDAAELKTKKAPKPKKIEVLSNTFSENSANDTFLLNLKALKGKSYESGDLLAVLPNNETQERLYSISKMPDKSILISIKKHEFGLCSTYLSEQKRGAFVNGYIVKNRRFHFPKNAKKVILIANGTGIGPFLGMIANNTKKINTELYWGARTEVAYNLYEDYIGAALAENKLQKFTLVYSRATTPKQYVQDAIHADAEKLVSFLNDGAIVMICGSMAMQKSVLTVLDTICQEHLGEKLAVFQNRNQLKMDCY